MLPSLNIVYYYYYGSTLKVISMPLRPRLNIRLWAPFSPLSETQESMCGWTWLSEQPGKMAPFDLMSLDSNCRRGRDGLLPHYSPNSLEVVFARPILMEHDVYVFPPFVLVGPLLRYFSDQCQHFPLTVIVPPLHPHHNCWAILQPMAVDSFLSGRKGDPAIWLFPSCTSPDFRC